MGPCAESVVVIVHHNGFPGAVVGAVLAPNTSRQVNFHGLLKNGVVGIGAGHQLDGVHGAACNTDFTASTAALVDDGQQLGGALPLSLGFATGDVVWIFH